MKYPKIFSIGDPLLKELLDGTVSVEEKVDGSQFRVWFDAEGKMHTGSKSVDYTDENPPAKQFMQAIGKAEKAFEGINARNKFFVFEFLEARKHNTVAYAREPVNNLILLDVSESGEWVSDYAVKQEIARRLGFECAPLIKQGEIKSVEEFNALLETESFLGGSKVEGVVVKNYNKFHQSQKLVFLLGQPLFGKYVSEKFKERNAIEWGEGLSMIEKVMKGFPVEPRWVKAVQHLKEQGLLTSTPKDIGKLLEELNKDFIEECKLEIMELLWKQYSHELFSAVKKGFPEWYKKRLLQSQFKR